MPIVNVAGQTAEDEVEAEETIATPRGTAIEKESMTEEMKERKTTKRKKKAPAKLKPLLQPPEKSPNFPLKFQRRRLHLKSQ